MASLPPPRDFVSSLISSISTQPPTSNSAQNSNPLKGAPSNTQKALLTLHVLFPNELLPAFDLLDRGLVTRLKAQNEAQHQNPEAQSRHVPDAHQSAAEAANPLAASSPWQGLGERTVRQTRGLGLPGLQSDQPPQPQGEGQAQARKAQAQDPLATQHQVQHRHDRLDLERQDPPHDREGPTARVAAGVTAHSCQPKTYVVRSGQVPSRNRSLSRTPTYEVRLDAWSCSCPAFAFSAFPATTSESSHNTHPVQHQTHNSASSSWSFGGLTLGAHMPICKHLLACVLVEHCSLFAHLVEEREVSIEGLAGWAAGWGD